jgi:hypothetical protein
MAFDLREDGFECDTLAGEIFFIPFEIIDRVSAYSTDIFAGDELRLEFETNDERVYTFSEREDSWRDLTSWFQEWANLDEEWQEQAMDDSFAGEPLVLWQRNLTSDEY